MFGLEKQQVKLGKFNSRKEFHGDDRVLAGDVKIEANCLTKAHEKLLGEISGYRAELARMGQPATVHLHPSIRDRKGPSFSQNGEGTSQPGAVRF